MRTASDPIERFRAWYEDACASGQALPNAMSLSTVSIDGRPASRMVLLSSFDRRGFVFHTNYDSRKGEEISAVPAVSLVFWWQALDRQVRVEGAAERTGAEESDDYFAGRPRGAQIGAWASRQSRVLDRRETLEARVREVAARYEGGPVRRPPNWGGFRVTPHAIEFWSGRGDRLHERTRYERSDGGWTAETLYP
jgi:pyridoxamine 5'-phosphate oxidase